LGVSPQPSRRTARRAVFVAAAALTLLGLRTAWLSPPPLPSQDQWSSLYRRAGDTYVKMLYLAGLTEGTPAGRRLLGTARAYYSLSARSNRNDTETAASLGLVLLLLGRTSEAKTALSNAALHAPPGTRSAALALSSWGAGTRSLAQLEQARGFLSRLGPGPLFLFRAYALVGQPAVGEQELRRAEQQAQEVAPKLFALIAVCGLITLAGPIGLVILLVRRKRAPVGPPATPSWGLAEAVEALVLWVLLAALASSALMRFSLSGNTVTSAATVLPSLIAGCGAVAWVWLASPGARFGWDLRAPLQSIGWGLAAAGILAPTVALIEQFLQSTWRPIEHPLVPVLASSPGWATKAALIAAACVVVPVLEETLFRGVLYRALRISWPPIGAALASGLVFAVGHMSFVGLLPYLLTGVVLAGLYEKTRTLLAPAVCHGAFNAFNLAILFALFG
jgi:membrane protease YdiL (CAAX protease family)